MVARTCPPSDIADLDQYGYERDARGRISEFRLENVSRGYSYDGNDQLLTSPFRSYEYDDNFNRLGTGTQIGKDNRLRQDADWNYEYDANGNLVAKRNFDINVHAYPQAEGQVQMAFQYDLRNRLTEVSTVKYQNGDFANAWVRYRYDAEDRMVERSTSDNGGWPEYEFFAYDGPNPVLHISSGGTVISRFLYGLGEDEIFAQDTSGHRWWLMSDHQGSVRKVLRAGGSVARRIDYDDFGNILSNKGTGPDPLAKYTGQFYDSKTQLQNFGARWYAADVGRFLNQDPIKEGTNLYAYVGNNPMNLTDPTGLAAFGGSGFSASTSLWGASAGGAVIGGATGSWAADVMQGIFGTIGMIPTANEQPSLRRPSDEMLANYIPPGMLDVRPSIMSDSDVNALAQLIDAQYERSAASLRVQKPQEVKQQPRELGHNELAALRRIAEVEARGYFVHWAEPYGYRRDLATLQGNLGSVVLGQLSQASGETLLAMGAMRAPGSSGAQSAAMRRPVNPGINVAMSTPQSRVFPTIQGGSNFSLGRPLFPTIEGGSGYNPGTVGASMSGSNFQLLAPRGMPTGQAGEVVAASFLRSMGVSDLVSLKNNSGQGIDWAGRLIGEPHFVEVKTTAGFDIPALSPAQRNIDSFVRSRLRTIVSGEPRWRPGQSVDPDVVRRAFELRLDTPAHGIRGTIIEIQNVHDVPIINWRPWHYP